MTTLASAVAIGDNQLLIDAPMTVGQIPGWVKIDSEMLYAGGQHFRTGTTLTLSSPATATHSQGATVTYAGRPFDADFRAATAGEGGGGAIAVDNTVDPPTEVTTIIAAGAQIDGATATLGIIVSVEEPTLPDAQFWLRKIADANSYQLYVRDAVGESWLLASAGVGSGDYGDGFEDGQTRQVGWFDIENGTLIGLTAGSDRLVLLRTTSADGSTTSELEMSSTQIKFTPAAGEFVVEDLPTADPVVANALWIDTAAGRVLKVSAG